MNADGKKVILTGSAEIFMLPVAVSLAPGCVQVITGFVLSIVFEATAKVPFRSDGDAPETTMVEPTGKASVPLPEVPRFSVTVFPLRITLVPLFPISTGAVATVAEIIFPPLLQAPTAQLLKNTWVGEVAPTTAYATGQEFTVFVATIDWPHGPPCMTRAAFVLFHA
jgi:hypothetical protein